MTAGGWRESRAWRELRPYARLVPGLTAYGVLRVVFEHAVGTGGFATPGSLDQGLAAFALVMVVLRLTVLIGVPMFVTYRLVRRAFGR